MPTLVRYELAESIATITMDDGKVNALSPQMFAELSEAVDRALADEAVIVLEGREGVFSAGFDLRILRSGGAEGGDLVLTGFNLAARLLGVPSPVVVACTGHAIAMGAFLMLAGDHRMAAAGPFRIGANEVAIGLTMPHFAIEMCRQRLTPAYFNRAIMTSEMFGPEEAARAGFVDEVVAAPDIREVARAKALQLAALDRNVYSATKRRVRHDALKAVRAGIELDGGVPLSGD